jgi:hypothetical protein
MMNNGLDSLTVAMEIARALLLLPGQPGTYMLLSDSYV